MTGTAPPAKPRWGWIENGVFRFLPMVPGFEDMGPVPFDVTLPSGEVRRVISAPD